MRGVTSISITLLIIASSIAGCIETLEEVTEVLGCTDEGADNFDADATSGLEELCLYCLLYTSPSPRDGLLSRMPSSA